MTEPQQPATAADECPACHHRDHDPGACEWCSHCELHYDDALAWVARHAPDLLREAASPTREAEQRVIEALRELATIAANNWHLNGYGDHPHDLAADCDEPVFVRFFGHLRALDSAPAAGEPPAPLDRIAELEGALTTLIEDICALDHVRFMRSLPMPDEWGPLVFHVGMIRLRTFRPTLPNDAIREQEKAAALARLAPNPEPTEGEG